MPGPRRAPRALAATAALLLPLTACGAADGGQTGAKGGKDAKGGEGFPYTVTNCGVKTTFEQPPERAVTMNQHVTEVMLALGLEDRMAGTAFLDDKILPEYRAAYDQIEVVADEYPSYEKLIATSPDFVYGGYASAFDKGSGRERAALAKDGITTRLNVEGCTDGPVGVREMRKELREVARTFGVPERAEKLIAEQEKQLAATAERLKGAEKPAVFVFDSGDSSAFTAGGHGIGNDLISRAGGRNVFAGLDKSFGDVSWEKVVERKPEVVVIYDYGGTPVAAKKKQLLNDPALKDVPAIKNERFAVLPLSSAVLGPRVPDAVDELADQLHPDLAAK
ncbi:MULTISPECIES: ABC transporter substrate-binding protein [Streptomyces]|uniref:ABC transporter substrate-binding protein n=1 Tax=Streptomyces odorifer TaxID=53450 RepID=A0A7Y6F4J0_9ACTN|nr:MULTISPECIES: ABC transporter substrate-binding protein [Streptomyces albidoflavus group]NUV37031.1 ABC transporter substrate-binding protein [Streptomyces sp. KAI-27]NUV50154.1 ABC transporter substrate-binding protein [Streptomyces sp. CAI-78]MBL0779872.1 ABC transporter substrate-binding protein [Streptomyces albidoflavus]MBL0799651.1 ABC transporter substrate-binding protein [Streptomyces albidoflavus]MCR0990398.1 ABC transporter substrate-binding protein [Streptomyces albidoflavus]